MIFWYTNKEALNKFLSYRSVEDLHMTRVFMTSEDLFNEL